MPVETAYQMLYYDQTVLCTEWVMGHGSFIWDISDFIPAASARVVREFNSAHHNLAQMRAENEKTLLFANEPTDGTQLASAAVSACPVICEVTDDQDHDHVRFLRINISYKAFTPTEWKWENSKGILLCKLLYSADFSNIASYTTFGQIHEAQKNNGKMHF